MRTLLALSSLAAALVFARPAQAADPPAALATFEQAHERVVQLVDSHAKTALIQREVDALLDYQWIAQSALGGPKHYAERCAERCAEFEALLGELIRSQYLERLESHERGSLEILGADVRERATKVDTRVRFVRGDRLESVEVGYVMHQVEGRWRVRDIITEDVSLTRNYKYEIHKIYKRGGIDAVIETLSDKLGA